MLVLAVSHIVKRCIVKIKWLWFEKGEFVSLYSSLTHTHRTGCRTSTMVAPLVLTSASVRCEGVLYSYGTSPVCLFYAIVTVISCMI